MSYVATVLFPFFTPNSDNKIRKRPAQISGPVGVLEREAKMSNHHIILSSHHSTFAWRSIDLGYYTLYISYGWRHYKHWLVYNPNLCAISEDIVWSPSTPSNIPQDVRFPSIFLNFLKFRKVLYCSTEWWI